MLRYDDPIAIEQRAHERRVDALRRLAETVAAAARRRERLAFQRKWGWFVKCHCGAPVSSEFGGPCDCPTGGEERNCGTVQRYSPPPD